jgi:hypothetical protein
VIKRRLCNVVFHHLLFPACSHFFAIYYYKLFRLSFSLSLPCSVAFERRRSGSRSKSPLAGPRSPISPRRMFSGLKTWLISLLFVIRLLRSPNFKVQLPSLYPFRQMSAAPRHFTNPFVNLQDALMMAETALFPRYTCPIILLLRFKPL